MSAIKWKLGANIRGRVGKTQAEEDWRVNCGGANQFTILQLLVAPLNCDDGKQAMEGRRNEYRIKWRTVSWWDHSSVETRPGILLMMRKWIVRWWFSSPHYRSVTCICWKMTKIRSVIGFVGAGGGAGGGRTWRLWWHKSCSDDKKKFTIRSTKPAASNESSCDHGMVERTFIMIGALVRKVVQWFESSIISMFFTHSLTFCPLLSAPILTALWCAQFIDPSSYPLHASPGERISSDNRAVRPFKSNPVLFPFNGISFRRFFFFRPPIGPCNAPVILLWHSIELQLHQNIFYRLHSTRHQRDTRGFSTRRVYVNSQMLLCPPIPKSQNMAIHCGKSWIRANPQGHIFVGKINKITVFREDLRGKCLDWKGNS